MSQLNLTEAESKLVGQLAGSDLADQLVSRGLPSRRLEAWHYTDLRQMLKSLPELAGEQAGTDIAVLPVAAKGPQLRLAHGKLDAKNLPRDWQFETGAASSRAPDMLVEINQALAPATHRLVVPKGTSETLVIDSTAFGDAAHSLAAIEIELAAGAELDVIHWVRSDAHAHVMNQNFVAHLGDGAKLNHTILAVGEAQTISLSSLHYHVAKNAKLGCFVVHSGPSLARTQIFAAIEGSGAHADFSGLNLMQGTDHGDITLDLDHAVPDTTSTETFKLIGKDRSTGIAQGKIKVAPDAQKVDAQMMVSGLLLDENAKIFVKPELEIFADDVICAHGATCGELDEDHLFYLMARGLDRQTATQLLVQAFAQELIDGVADEDLQAYLSNRITNWL